MTRIDQLRSIVERTRQRQEVAEQSQSFGDSPGGSGGAAAFRRMIVKEVFNDHLRCRDWDGETVGETDYLVAKRPEMRHHHRWYQDVSTVVTVDAQTVTMDGETYKVTPAYIVDVTEIWPITASSGVIVADVELTLMDMGPRQWARSLS